MLLIDRLAIYERDGGICGFCGEPVPIERFHVDHVLAVGLGGSNDQANLRVAHVRCNIADSSRVRRERRRLGLGFDVGRGLLTLRLPTETYEQIRVVARDEYRSVTQQIIWAVKEWLAGRGRKLT